MKERKKERKKEKVGISERKKERKKERMIFINTKAMVRSSDYNIDFFVIVA